MGRTDRGRRGGLYLRWRGRLEALPLPFLDAPQALAVLLSRDGPRRLDVFVVASFRVGGGVEPYPLVGRDGPAGPRRAILAGVHRDPHPFGPRPRSSHSRGFGFACLRHHYIELFIEIYSLAERVFGLYMPTKPNSRTLYKSSRLYYIILLISATKGEVGDMSIGGNLRALRKRRGWGQQELARRAGITQPVISVLESGRQERARSDTLAKLAEALGVEVGDFFAEGAPPPIPDPPKTPLTDEPESDFDAQRFGPTDLEGAEALAGEVGKEFDALGGYIKALKAAGIGGDDLRLKQARRRLREAKRRTYASTSRTSDLALNAEFGRDREVPREVHDTVAAYVGQAEAVAAEIEAENTEAHPEAS